jgi:hypothetical protein
MGELGLMTTLTGLICILGGVVTAMNAHRAYAMVLAATFFCQSIALSVVMSALFKIDLTYWHVLVPLILAIVVYLMARLVVLWLWGAFTLVGLILLAGIGLSVASNIQDVVNVTTVGITYLLGLVAAIALKKHGKVLTIAVTSGYNVGIGLITIILSLVTVSSGETFALLIALFVLLGVIAGVYYQYKVDRRLLESL